MAGLNLSQPLLHLMAIFQPAQRDGLLQAVQSFFHAAGKTISDSLLFFFAARRATQNVSLLALSNGYLLHFHFRPNLCPILWQQLRFKLLHLAARRAHQILPATLRIDARFSSLTMPPSNTQILRALPYLRSTMRSIVSMVETSARLTSNVS